MDIFTLFLKKKIHSTFTFLQNMCTHEKEKMTQACYGKVYVNEKTNKPKTRSKRSKSTKLSCEFVIRPSSAHKELTVLLRKCKQTSSSVAVYGACLLRKT